MTTHQDCGSMPEPERLYLPVTDDLIRYARAVGHPLGKEKLEEEK